VMHDELGEPIMYADGGEDARWLVFPASLAPMVALTPLFFFYWYFLLIGVAMVASLVLRRMGVRGVDLLSGIKMFLIRGRRQLYSRRVEQRTIRGLRG
jgi:hypothetical protein